MWGKGRGSYLPRGARATSARGLPPPTLTLSSLPHAYRVASVSTTTLRMKVVKQRAQETRPRLRDRREGGEPRRGCQCASLPPYSQPRCVHRCLQAAHSTEACQQQPTRTHHLPTEPQTANGGRPSQMEPQTTTQHHETTRPRPVSSAFVCDYWTPNCRASCGVMCHSVNQFSDWLVAPMGSLLKPQ